MNKPMSLLRMNSFRFPRKNEQDCPSNSSNASSDKLPLRAFNFSRSASVTDLMSNFRQQKQSPKRSTLPRMNSIRLPRKNEQDCPSSSTSSDKLPLRAFTFSRSASVTDLMSNFRQQKQSPKSSTLSSRVFTFSRSAIVTDLSFTSKAWEEDVSHCSSIIPTVRFSSTRKCREILSRKAMTEEERQTLWYTQRELNSLKENEVHLLSPSCRRELHQDMDKIFNKTHFLSECMNCEETERLLRDQAAIAKHARVYQKLSTTTPSTSETTKNRKRPSLTTTRNLRGLERRLPCHMSELRQAMAKNAREVVLNGYYDDKEEEKVARAYHDESRTALLFARIMAEADAQAVKDDDNQDMMPSTTSTTTTQGGDLPSTTPCIGASPRGGRRGLYRRSASTPQLFQV